MIPSIKNILYATDLSKNSAYAFRYAVNSAQKHKAYLFFPPLFCIPPYRPGEPVELENGLHILKIVDSGKAHTNHVDQGVAIGPSYKIGWVFDPQD